MSSYWFRRRSEQPNPPSTMVGFFRLPSPLSAQAVQKPVPNLPGGQQPGCDEARSPPWLMAGTRGVAVEGTARMFSEIRRMAQQQDRDPWQLRMIVRSNINRRRGTSSREIVSSLSAPSGRSRRISRTVKRSAPTGSSSSRRSQRNAVRGPMAGMVGRAMPCPAARTQ